MSRLILYCSAPNAGTVAQVKAIADAFAARAAENGESWTIRPHLWTDDALAHLRRVVTIGGPAILVSCARSGERKARRQKRTQPQAYWVHVETLKQGGVMPDLLAVPHHDWSADLSANEAALRLLGAPHSVTAETCALRRDEARLLHGVSPAERVAIFLIGGPNPAFAFDDAGVGGVLATLRRFIDAGHRCFVTASRRTSPDMRRRLDAIDDPQVTVWDGNGANPYRNYLAMGDCFLVTEDSITMTCEAVATGMPTVQLALTAVPGPVLDKFRRFQEAWRPYLSAEADAQAPAAERRSSADLPDDCGLIIGRMLDDLAMRA